MKVGQKVWVVNHNHAHFGVKCGGVVRGVIKRIDIRDKIECYSILDTKYDYRYYETCEGFVFKNKKDALLAAKEFINKQIDIKKQDIKELKKTLKNMGLPLETGD